MSLFKPSKALQRFMMDCGFWRSRKWVGATLAEVGLQAAAISYCYEHSTDGELPAVADMAQAFGLKEREVKAAAQKLIARKVWEADQGVRIVGYLDHNPSTQEVQQHRNKRVEASAKANHVKYHGEKSDPDCRWCSDSESESESQSDSESDTTADSLSGVEGCRALGVEHVETSSSSVSEVPRGDPQAVDDDDPETTFEYRLACSLLARADLERRQTEKGPVGDAEAWHASVTRQRLERHREHAGWSGSPQALVALLTPKPAEERPRSAPYVPEVVDQAPAEVVASSLSEARKGLGRARAS